MEAADEEQGAHITESECNLVEECMAILEVTQNAVPQNTLNPIQPPLPSARLTPQVNITPTQSQPHPSSRRPTSFNTQRSLTHQPL